MKLIEMWVDGSSIKQIADTTRFHGGAGVVLIYKEKERYISESLEDGTNNMAELLAPCLGLEVLKERCNVQIMTDSAYTMNCITKWMGGWVRRGWRTSDGKPVKNVELIQRLHKACQQHNIEWVKVKGHSGLKYNDMADELACKASKKLKDAEESKL